jgi:SAM-dependent methyltransferase
MNRKKVKQRIVIVLKPFVSGWFWFSRWVIHNRFLGWLKNDQIGKPSLASRPFILGFNAFRLGRSVWNKIFADYALCKYKRLIEIHYSKKGVGYFNHEQFSEKEQLESFHSAKGRIAYYFSHNASLLTYHGSDSFLDAGCGRGQNIKELVTYFPDSQIKGFDVNEGALGVIRTALAKKVNVQIELGSVTDFKYLASYADQSVDHVIISHVMTIIVDSGLEETQNLRQKIINHLIRIARRSLLILDGDIVHNLPPIVLIEQNTRCALRESFLPYFEEHKKSGEIYAMFSPETQAILYKRKLD